MDGFQKRHGTLYDMSAFAENFPDCSMPTEGSHPLQPRNLIRRIVVGPKNRITFIAKAHAFQLAEPSSSCMMSPRIPAQLGARQ